MPPAYLTLGAKLRFSLAAVLSMMAGAQLVHAIYRPLDVVLYLTSVMRLSFDMGPNANYG